MRPWISHSAKLVVSHALYWTGLLQLWQRLTLRQRAVVLMYHRVLTDEEQARTASHPAIVVSRDTFARHMALLKRRFTVLSAAELADRLDRKIPLPDSSCVITFDDGWRDNFTNALPVLAGLGLPALVFLPINYIGRPRVFWQEALTHLLLRAVARVRQSPEAGPRLTALLSPLGLEHALDVTGEDPRRSIIAMVGAQKQWPRQTIEALVAGLGAELGVRLEELAAIDGFIDWDQARAMAQQGVTFGGHGVEHLLLTQVSSDEALREIRGAKEALEANLPPPVATFSYPNGFVTEKIVEQVRESGYRLAFITKRGPVSCSDDPLTIRRLNVHEAATRTNPMFLARMVGLW